MRNLFLTAMLVLSMWAGTAEARDYNIVAYGAKADTTVLSTKALQQAIDDCTKAGGGRVLVPTGQYKIGSIVLKSDVHLYLEQGATLYGSTDLKDYLPMKSDYVSLRTQTSTIQLIYADKARNVVIDGFGTSAPYPLHPKSGYHHQGHHPEELWLLDAALLGL